jgi:hypothetical protein
MVTSSSNADEPSELGEPQLHAVPNRRIEMTKEELAARLNGRQYQEEIREDEELIAKREGLLVIFGASDDLCELRGAINDEVSAWQGADIHISKGGQLLATIEKDEAEVLKKYGVLKVVEDAQKAATKVTAQWCKTKDFSWTLETSAPHATFDIMEDEDGYCRGVVLDLKELQ